MLEFGYRNGDVDVSVCKSLGLQIMINVDGEVEWGSKIIIYDMGLNCVCVLT